MWDFTVCGHSGPDGQHSYTAAAKKNGFFLLKDKLGTFFYQEYNIIQIRLSQLANVN